ncbi:MAG: amidohydrolase family protein [Burkholderiales bacterium]
MRTYDLHSHVIPPTIVEAMKADPQRFGMKVVERDGRLFFERRGQLSEMEREFHDVDAKIAAMDRMRIDVSALSVAPPTYFYNLPAEAGLAASRLSNDGIARMVEKYPARLRGMATLPMQDPDAAITELERVVKEYGFKAVEMGTSVEGEQLAHPKFRRLLKTVEQLGCFIFTHPYACSAKGGMDSYELFNTVGYPLDSTLMAAHLMASGALDDLKTLKIVIPHGGGYVPYQIGRFARAHRHRPAASVATQSSPYDLFKRFYFDALTHDPRATRHLINMAGADHVVIGTDNPFNMGYENPVAALDATPGLTAEEKAQICGGTARMLFGED